MRARAKSEMFILAIDQGTTNTKALVFDENGQISRSASASCSTDYPEPGWAEQSANEIWRSTSKVIAEACKGIEDQIAGIGISNQRETLVVWDAKTSRPVGPAPIWQCRRTALACADLVRAGHGDVVRDRTGLEINPLFPASKLAWILQNRPDAAEKLAAGDLRAGTVDAWLLWNLTGGSAFATDHSNASRTLLFDTDALSWSDELARIFHAPLSCLPEALASDCRFGETAEGATALPASVPIHAMLGDSHAALYGHGVRAPGMVKATYGTGSSLMALTPDRIASEHGLSGTIAWTARGVTSYALEGNITVSAQAAAFMTEILGLQDVEALSSLAQTVTDSAGVVFVPALAGLGAPHWNDDARGTISGMHHGTTSAHIARATFEAICHQVADVFEAMESDFGAALQGLSADGGGSRNAYLMQMQADLINRPVKTRTMAEVGAYGVASLVADALGQPFSESASESEAFLPAWSDEKRKSARRNWTLAVGMLAGARRYSNTN